MSQTLLPLTIFAMKSVARHAKKHLPLLPNTPDSLFASVASRSIRPQQNERVSVNVLHTKGLWPSVEEAAALFGNRGDRLVFWPRRASFTFRSKIVSACPAEACQVDRPTQHRYSPFDVLTISSSFAARATPDFPVSR